MPKKTGGKSKKPIKLHVVKPTPPEKPQPVETKPIITEPSKPAPVIIKTPETPKPGPVRITVPKPPEFSPKLSAPHLRPHSVPVKPKGIGALEIIAWLLISFLFGGIFFKMFESIP